MQKYNISRLSHFSLCTVIYDFLKLDIQIDIPHNFFNYYFSLFEMLTNSKFYGYWWPSFPFIQRNFMKLVYQFFTFNFVWFETLNNPMLSDIARSERFMLRPQRISFLRPRTNAPSQGCFLVIAQQVLGVDFFHDAGYFHISIVHMHETFYILYFCTFLHFIQIFTLCILTFSIFNTNNT